MIEKQQEDQYSWFSGCCLCSIFQLCSPGRSQAKRTHQRTRSGTGSVKGTNQIPFTIVTRLRRSNYSLSLISEILCPAILSKSVGNKVASLIFFSSRICIVILSSPSENPASDGIPYLKASR